MKIRHIIITIIVVLLLIGMSFASFGTELTDLQDKKQELQNQIDSANTEAEKVNIELTDLLKQIYNLQSNISEYEAEIEKLDGELSVLQKDIKGVENQLKTLETNYEKQKKALETRLVASYEAGETKYLDVLLSSNSLSEFISNYFLIEEITQYDNELLDNIGRQKDLISNMKEELKNKESDLKTKKNEKQKRAIALKNAKVVKDKYASQLSDEEKALKEKVDELEAEINKVDRDILNIAVGAIGEDYVGGELAWPVPSSTIITSPFGMRFHPILKINRMHNGIDIGASTGKDIVATNDGVVIKAGYVGSYGNLVMIDHGGGVVTVYGHGSEIIAETGQKVSRGEVIMLIGSTGLSTGPHLHFEVRINGSCVDPLPYVTSKKNIEN